MMRGNFAAGMRASPGAARRSICFSTHFNGPVFHVESNTAKPEYACGERLINAWARLPPNE